MRTHINAFMETLDSFLPGKLKYLFVSILAMGMLFLFIVLLLVGGCVLWNLHRDKALSAFSSRLVSMVHYNGAEVVEMHKGLRLCGNGGYSNLTVAVLLKTERTSYKETEVKAFYSQRNLTAPECGDHDKRVRILTYTGRIEDFDFRELVSLYSDAGNDVVFNNIPSIETEKDSVYFIVFAHCPDVHQIFTGI